MGSRCYFSSCLAIYCLGLHQPFRRWCGIQARNAAVLRFGGGHAVYRLGDDFRCYVVDHRLHCLRRPSPVELGERSYCALRWRRVSIALNAFHSSDRSMQNSTSCTKLARRRLRKVKLSVARSPGTIRFLSPIAPSRELLEARLCSLATRWIGTFACVYSPPLTEANA